ncbi:uncharacterized protein LOC123866357 [Maniola jurtina]|uniref:uncharacterized protein LOC123866357 n=1 Tax=Maniola jurtina TaxID=191418 RepID=UPI001E68A979|nr:uncharacterized protein LOC123866357 [Maniola jurtina]
MYKYFIICNIFFISIIRGKVIPPVNNTATILFPVVSPQSEKNDNPTYKLISEGGSITHNINAVTLPSNDLTLINLEKNVSVTKGTSVVARKGVTYEESGIKSHEDKLASEIHLPKVANNTNKLVELQKGTNATTLNITNIPNDVQKVNVTKIHKPLLVSSELLAKMDTINNVSIDENGPSIKAHVLKAGSHPGMILPIVITILVVPMFAVVAYMALKRGQEAWKNRHYKRMDFLLDGMYND